MKPDPTPLATFELEANQGYTDHDGPSRYRSFPVRLSVPLLAKIAGPGDSFEVRDPAGQVLPAVIRPFVSWADGSTRLLEIWFPSDLRRGAKARYSVVRVEPSGAGTTPAKPVQFLSDPPAFTVTALLPRIAPQRAKVELTASKTAPAAGCRELEQPFEIRGPKNQPQFRGALVRKTFSWYAGAAFEFRLTNCADRDTTMVRGVRLEFTLPGAGSVRYCVRQTTMVAKDHPRLVERKNPLEIRADHEGIHVPDPALLGERESDYPPYERGAYLGAVAPWLGVSDRAASWLLVVPEALERRPKSWRIDGHKVTIQFHPTTADPLEWRQGMTLFQRFVLVRLPATAQPGDFENEAQSWLRPPIVRLDPDVYRAGGWRIPFRYAPGRFPKTEFQFRDSYNFSWTPGTFHWGDQVTGYKGGGTVTPGGHGFGRNLEYDFPAVAAKEYARTGVGHLWRLCRASAEHMMYTDFVAVSNDVWKEGGIAHHCLDHTSGSCYPSHMWAEGLTLYYQLSGDRQALATAKRVGDFFLHYIRDRFQVVQGTAREVGWTLIALAALYDLTRESRYLEGIQRVVDYHLDRPVETFFPTDATFTQGVAIIGFDRTRHFHRDEDTRRFILAVLEIMFAKRRDEIGLFEYWLDPEQGAIPYIQAHLPEGLNIGYRLSGDEKYLRAAWRLYQIHQAGGPLTVQNRLSPPECGFAAGGHITWMGCLQSFAEKGWLDKLQYPEPGIA